MHSLSTQVAIVGAGPGGLSAGLWCADLGIDHIVLESGGEAGGQLLWTFNEIDNYAGVRAADGRELRDLMLTHALRRGVRIRYGARCAAFGPDPLSLTLADGETVGAKALIIATGVSRRVPDLADYERFVGKGVLFSGKRDKDQAKGKRAIVVGGGDAAFENALILAEVAESVTLVHRRGEFSARPEFTEAVADNRSITILTDTLVTELRGGGSLESVSLRDSADGSEWEIGADVIVFRIGVKPNSEVFAAHVRTDARGYIEVDAECRTGLPGVYAVGDVANPVSPTVSTACGMGATAVKSAFFWS